MSKEHPLNHHEQLRYDYLFKNIYYLNEREKKEFDYLQAKINRESGDVSGEKEEILEPLLSPFANNSLPLYSNRSRSNKYRKKDPVPKVKKEKRKLRLGRLFVGLLVVMACIAFGMIFMFLKGYQTAASPDKPANAKAAQVQVFNGQDTKDGVNILILGTDGRIGQNSAETRTDSIMVLNVGGSDKKIKMVSFMRDNLVYIDGYSKVVAGKKQADNKLNGAY